MWDMDDVIVTLFLVRGGHNLANPGIDGSVVALPPIQECVFVHSGRIEVVWAAHCHHVGVMLY